MALEDKDVVHLAKLKTLKSLAVIECEHITDRGVCCTKAVSLWVEQTT